MHATDTSSGATKLIMKHQPLIIAHRGYSDRAPENTLPAFKLALEAGADLVELDYRHSKDGVPVVIHDPKLDRSTNSFKLWKRKRLHVASKTAVELRQLDAGAWFGLPFAGAKIPLLREALELIHTRSMPLIEHKAGEPGVCIRLLRDLGLVNKVVVQSFDWEYLRRFHEEEPSQVLAALGPPGRLANGKRPLGVVRKLNSAWLKQLHKTGAKVAVWNQKVSKKAIRLAHEAGLKVWVYTVNEPRLARRLLTAGIDGIITNDPVLIQKELAQWRRRGRKTEHKP